MKKGRVSPELLEKVKSSVNILEVIGEHVVLRKSGASYVGLCPFHSERSPSFSVSETKQLYHCYGCKKGGDLVTFVMEILGVSFPEAVEDLADRARVALPKDWSETISPEVQQQDAANREKRALGFKLNRFAAAYFHQNISRGAEEYFLSRGIGSEWIKTFYLGAAPHSWDSLVQHLISAKAPLDLAVEMGLIRPSNRKDREVGLGYFDLFRNRALFPIVNMRGKIAGFGGRTMDPQDLPKYLNSPDSLLFQKGKLAFGLFQAQKYIREQDEVLVVEGYFDVLAMYAAGFRNVVATCGTSLTADHLKLFKRLANRVTILFDGDEAGRAATIRAMELGLELGQILYGAQLPQGMDPDEVVLQPGGVPRMGEILKGSQPILDQEIEESIRTANGGPEDRVQALKRIGNWLGRLRDSVGQEVRLQAIQKRLEIPRELILGVVAPALAGKRGVQKKERASEIKGGGALVRISRTDRILWSGLIWGQEYSSTFMAAKAQLPSGVTPADLFTHPRLREISARFLSETDFLERFRLNPGTLIQDEPDPSIRSLLTETLLRSELPFSLEDFRGALFKCAAKLWARFSQRIKWKISEAEINKDVDLQVQLMKDYLDVQRKMKEFNSFYDQE